MGQKSALNLETETRTSVLRIERPEFALTIEKKHLWILKFFSANQPIRFNMQKTGKSEDINFEK